MGKKEFDKTFWMSRANAFIEEVEDEVPTNFTFEYREKLALWLFKMDEKEFESFRIELENRIVKLMEKVRDLEARIEKLEGE